MHPHRLPLLVTLTRATQEEGSRQPASCLERILHPGSGDKLGPAKGIKMQQTVASCHKMVRSRLGVWSTRVARQ